VKTGRNRHILVSDDGKGSTQAISTQEDVRGKNSAQDS
jgi:hypothetical protein